MSEFNDKPSGAYIPQLNRTEITTLFLSTLTDVYNLKRHVIGYLPLLAEKASFSKLKMAIVETALEVEAQKLRIDIIFRILKYELSSRPAPLKGTLDIEGYIRENMDSMPSYKTDFVLFTHLLMIENMEITYFRVLRMLSAHIRHKEIHVLVVQSLQEAVRKKKAFEIIGGMYRAESFSIE